MTNNNELERKDIVVDSDLEVNDDCNAVTAYIETWFDVDAKFGTNTADNDGRWLNLYATYHIDTGELTMEYFVEDDTEVTGPFSFSPTEAEKKLVKAMMEECCLSQHHCTMKEMCDDLFSVELGMGGM